MAIDLLIPRLEWNYVTEIGNATGTDPVIAAMANTSDILVGMTVTGNGVVAGSTVLSKTATTVTLSSPLSATNAGVLFTFFFRFDFTYPAVTDTDLVLDAKEKVTKSLSGITQVQIDYIEETRSMLFDFLTGMDLAALKTFFSTWAVYGKVFTYFPDKADSVSAIYETSGFKFAPKRTVKKHPSFLYSLAISFRRIV